MYIYHAIEIYSNLRTMLTVIINRKEILNQHTIFVKLWTCLIKKNKNFPGFFSLLLKVIRLMLNNWWRKNWKRISLSLDIWGDYFHIIRHINATRLKQYKYTKCVCPIDIEARNHRSPIFERLHVCDVIHRLHNYRIAPVEHYNPYGRQLTQLRGVTDPTIATLPALLMLCTCSTRICR